MCTVISPLRQLLLLTNPYFYIKMKKGYYSTRTKEKKMRKVISVKKALSVLLTALLILSVCPVLAFAAEDTKDKADPTRPPVLLIDGINAVALVRDMGEKEEETVFPFDNSSILSAVKDNAAPLWDMLDGDYSAESENAVIDTVLELMDDFSMNDDGTSKYDISADWVLPGTERPRYTEEGDGEDGGSKIRETLDQIKKWFSDLFHRDAEELTEEELRQRFFENRSIYKFQYDWRLDPFEIADQLKAYIDYMKELTGFDTVTLVGFSEGAAMLNTYLSVYGYDGLDAVIWCCGAHNGVELVGQLFTGRINVDAAALTEYIRDNGDSSASAEMLSSFMQALKSIGVTGNVLNYTNNIIRAMLADGGLRRIIRESFAKMPAIWSLIGDAYYEEAKAYIFNQPGDAETYAELIAAIDRYHYGVQAHSSELIAGAAAATGKIGVISKYGLRVTPLIENADILTDGLLDVKATSNGAVAAPYGKTLNSGYVQAVNDGHNHLSPDGMIDASTALYPEQTWFIKNLPHSSLPDDLYQLLYYIAFSDHQVTVFENEAFPQFSVYDPIEGEIRPMKDASSPNAFMRAMQRIKMFFISLIERIRSFFGIKK